VAFPLLPNPSLLATGGAEKKLRVFDLSRPSTSSSTSPNGASDASNLSYEIGPGVHQGTIKSIVWGPDQNIIVSAADDKKIRWWDLRSRDAIGSFELEGLVGSCEMGVGDGSAFLSVAAGKSVYFFEAQSRLLLKSVTTQYDVCAVALHSQTRKFVTGGSSDTWVRVYDYDSEKELDVYKGHHGPIWTVSFSPDGKLYATGSEDGTIKLWKYTNEPYGLWR
jgi:serine-threonine kinase receptor-associated protein